MVFIAQILNVFFPTPVSANSKLRLTWNIHLEFDGIQRVPDPQGRIIDFLPSEVGMTRIFCLERVKLRSSDQFVQSGICLIMRILSRTFDRCFKVAVAESDLLSRGENGFFPLI